MLVLLSENFRSNCSVHKLLPELGFLNDEVMPWVDILRWVRKTVLEEQAVRHPREVCSDVLDPSRVQDQQTPQPLVCTANCRCIGTKTRSAVECFEVRKLQLAANFLA